MRPLLPGIPGTPNAPIVLKRKRLKEPFLDSKKRTIQSQGINAEQQSLPNDILLVIFKQAFGSSHQCIQLREVSKTYYNTDYVKCYALEMNLMQRLQPLSKTNRHVFEAIINMTIHIDPMQALKSVNALRAKEDRDALRFNVIKKLCWSKSRFTANLRSKIKSPGLQLEMSALFDDAVPVSDTLTRERKLFDFLMKSLKSNIDSIALNPWLDKYPKVVFQVFREVVRIQKMSQFQIEDLNDPSALFRQNWIESAQLIQHFDSFEQNIFIEEVCFAMSNQEIKMSKEESILLLNLTKNVAEQIEEYELREAAFASIANELFKLDRDEALMWGWMLIQNTFTKLKKEGIYDSISMRNGFNLIAAIQPLALLNEIKSLDMLQKQIKIAVPMDIDEDFGVNDSGAQKLKEDVTLFHTLTPLIKVIGKGDIIDYPLIARTFELIGFHHFDTLKILMDQFEPNELFKIFRMINCSSVKVKYLRFLAENYRNIKGLLDCLVEVHSQLPPRSSFSLVHNLTDQTDSFIGMALIDLEKSLELLDKNSNLLKFLILPDIASNYRLHKPHAKVEAGKIAELMMLNWSQSFSTLGLNERYFDFFVWENKARALEFLEIFAKNENSPEQLLWIGEKAKKLKKSMLKAS